MNVAVSRDGGNTFTVSQVTAGNVRNNQDQRIVTDQSGNAYLTFDNGIQGGKGTACTRRSRPIGAAPGPPQSGSRR